MPNKSAIILLYKIHNNIQINNSKKIFLILINLYIII